MGLRNVCMSISIKVESPSDYSRNHVDKKFQVRRPLGPGSRGIIIRKVGRPTKWRTELTPPEAVISP